MSLRGFIRITEQLKKHDPESDVAKEQERMFRELRSGLQLVASLGNYRQKRQAMALLDDIS